MPTDDYEDLDPEALAYLDGLEEGETEGEEEGEGEGEGEGGDLLLGAMASGLEPLQDMEDGETVDFDVDPDASYDEDLLPDAMDELYDDTEFGLSLSSSGPDDYIANEGGPSDEEDVAAMAERGELDADDLEGLDDEEIARLLSDEADEI